MGANVERADAADRRGGSRAVVTYPDERLILLTREFDAPRHLVYRAWTMPELIRRWWSAKRGRVTVADVDLRPGGRWRFVMVTHRGFEVGFRGEYREIVKNERIVCTEIYEADPGQESLNTLTFREENGRTVFTLLAEYASRAERDAAIASGMDSGVDDAFDLLEEVVESIV